MICPTVPFPVTLSDPWHRFQGHSVIFRPIDTLNVLCAQLTRDLFAIDKFLLLAPVVLCIFLCSVAGSLWGDFLPCDAMHTADYAVASHWTMLFVHDLLLSRCSLWQKMVVTPLVTSSKETWNSCSSQPTLGSWIWLDNVGNVHSGAWHCSHYSTVCLLFIVS